MFSLGFAVEYGVLDWLTAAVQWWPGWVMWSDSDTKFEGIYEGTVNNNGVTDIVTGIFVQIIGEKAPIRSDLFSLSLVPGFKMPLPGPDSEEEVRRALSDPQATITGANADRHVFGLGTQMYFSYKATSWLNLGLFSEFDFYPMKLKLSKAGAVDLYNAVGKEIDANGLIYIGQAMADLGTIDPNDPRIFPTAATLAVDAVKDKEMEYGCDFKVQPSFGVAFPIKKLGLFAASLPLAFHYNPGNKVEGLVDPTEFMLLALNPGVTLMMLDLPLPIEIAASYNIPLWGKNSPALQVFALQVNLFFAF